MGNIIEYLKRHGDVSLEEMAFNEVDNVVLSQIAYLEFEGIVPKNLEGGYVTVEEASSRLFAQYSLAEIREHKHLHRDTPLVLKAMAQGRRFKNARLSNYVCLVDFKSPLQFAAIQIDLLDGTTYVAFRGTDDYLGSWEEDFSMVYRTIPAQKEAAKYLHHTMEKGKQQIRLGGHSKGGNLAIYAAMKANDSIKTRILKIYDNDGPGFEADVLEGKAYQDIKNRIIHIAPTFSVVGMLFEHDCEQKIVCSSEKGIQQHDCMSWKVADNAFIMVDQYSKKSCLLTKALANWLYKMKLEERRNVVKSLFGALGKKGFEKLSDLRKLKAKNFFGICNFLVKLNKPTKSALVALVFSLINNYGREVGMAISLLFTKRVA